MTWGNGSNAPLPPPGWYSGPVANAAQQYWDGTAWTDDGPAAQGGPPEATAIQAIPVGKMILIPLAAAFGSLAFFFAVNGMWQTFDRVAMMAVVIGAPASLLVLALGRLRQVRRRRESRRQYEEDLIRRSDQEHRAVMSGDADAGVFGAYQPAHLDLDPNHLPDAEQMRRQAWQPEMGDSAMAAVRPTNPAPWHIVTQVPTRQFSSRAEGHSDADGQQPN